MSENYLRKSLLVPYLDNYVKEQVIIIDKAKLERLKKRNKLEYLGKVEDYKVYTNYETYYGVEYNR